MLTVTQIEDAILDALRTDVALAGYVRLFEPVPSLDIDELKKVFVNFPAIGVIASRGEYSYQMSDVQNDTGLFAVLCLNRNLRSRVAAIRGGADGEIGIWDMVEDCRTVLLAGISGTGIVNCLPKRRYLVFAGEALAIASLEVEIKWRNR